MAAEKFSFTELERRIGEIPDGPAKIVASPSWIVALNVVGWVGFVMGLAPSLLITFVEPAHWMVWIARSGVWIAGLALAPGFVKNLIDIFKTFRHWRAGLVQQLDHDLVHYRQVAQWLTGFPIEVRDEALRFARQGQERMASKLGLVVGSLEKLGLLPIVVAVFIQVRAQSADLGDTPAWQIVLAIFLVLAYGIGWWGSLMRLRMQLYEMVLSDSLACDQKGREGSA